MKENERYDITGMTCAACSAHVDKAVRKLDGVKEVNVNLLTNSMVVTYEDKVTPEIIEKAVSDAGYGAKLSGGSNKEKKTEMPDFSDKTTPRLLKRLIVSLVLLLLQPLSYKNSTYRYNDNGYSIYNCEYQVIILHNFYYPTLYSVY
jgi:cation transport ATPase